MAGLLLVLGALAACSEDEALPAPVATAVDPVGASALLADLVDAVAAGAATDDGPWPSHLVSNAAALGVTDFSLRFVAEDAALTPTLPDGQWAAAVDLSWRFDGRDPLPAHVETTFVFEGRGADLRLVSVGGGGRVSPLWLAVPVVVAANADAMVLLAGDDTERAQGLLDRATEAVRVVEEELRRPEQGLVVEVPGGDTSVERTLDVERGSYDGIAAVTSMVDGTTAPGSPVHVFVNDAVFSGLSEHGAQVVITHEAVHVATGAAAQQGVPLWLTEGFADHVALLDSDLPMSVTAAQVIARVRRDGLPDELPTDADFDARNTGLGAAYEGAWIACRLLAERADLGAMVELQDRVAAGEPLAKALRATHALTPKELTELWRAELRRLSR